VLVEPQADPQRRGEEERRDVEREEASPGPAVDDEGGAER
jgi:hypothetical protein